MFFWLLLPVVLPAQETAVPRSGEGIAVFLKRLQRTESWHRAEFKRLNKGKFDKNGGLKLGVKYVLPPLRKEGIEPLFGKRYARYPIESDELKGACFYLVSGHGGPDPGAIGILGSRELHEDEYAYDIVLRLARCLLMKGARVHIIIQDARDGIRDDLYLSNSRRETCMGARIPLNQIERLRQRCNKINALAAKEGNGYGRAVFVHLDSRSKKEQTDVFFYHTPGHAFGKRTAETLHRTFSRKYGKHQPGRGFSGTIGSRNLYVLRHTRPASVFLELGNIQNKRDQQRFILADNRQALANWICEGLVDDYRSGRRK